MLGAAKQPGRPTFDRTGAVLVRLPTPGPP